MNSTGNYVDALDETVECVRKSLINYEDCGNYSLASFQILLFRKEVRLNGILDIYATPFYGQFDKPVWMAILDFPFFLPHDYQNPYDHCIPQKKVAIKCNHQLLNNLGISHIQSVKHICDVLGIDKAKTYRINEQDIPSYSISHTNPVGTPGTVERLYFMKTNVVDEAVKALRIRNLNEMKKNEAVSVWQDVVNSVIKDFAQSFKEPNLRIKLLAEYIEI